MVLPDLLPDLLPLTIPSPSQGVWYLGPVPIRGYALSIILGIVAAIWIGERRWIARGGRSGEVTDLALWAVPFGLVGGRLYHVATDYQLYFGDDRNPVTALYVWRGGLGIWGAVALGAVGVMIGAHRSGIRCCRCSTPSPRGCWWPRPSVAGATGSTRSSSAAPPTCRGRSRSAPR
jgi:prolipoprotein diacylglyceryltransferase